MCDCDCGTVEICAQGRERIVVLLRSDFASADCWDWLLEFLRIPESERAGVNMVNFIAEQLAYGPG